MKRILTLLLFCIAGSLSLVNPSAGLASDAPPRVMTRNLYLGADLTPLITAPTASEFLQRATETFQQVQATDFHARAKVLAREIKQADPSLIGLQEVSLWRRGELGVLDGPATPATTVLYDYLQLLLAELDALGRPYMVVVVQEEGDNEVPSTLGYDLRLTQRDVILAKAQLPLDQLRVTNPRSANFATNLTLPTVAGPVLWKRGWTAVDARLDGRRLRFINTHLESFSAVIRTAQANELLAGPANTTLPTLLVGDLNSPPEELTPSAYSTLRAAGFKDAWIIANDMAPGLTCCNAEDLRNSLPAFDQRIDYVLLRDLPRDAIERARRTGIDPEQRTPSGLWPSDHAGVVVELDP